MSKSLADMTPKEIGAALIALDGTNRRRDYYRSGQSIR